MAQLFLKFDIMPREIKVLNVAEKPSVAREITRHLGAGTAVNQRSVRGVNVSEFPYTLMQTQCRMVVTAVRGHRLNLDFGAEFKQWKSCPPRGVVPGTSALVRDPRLSRLC